ncbi:hypothetical protein [Streptomyces noursei]|uniref:Uncharacterized protein n=1 Tax=Streptomyces noursei TaxID=1971 RepID=A0A401QY77_STRNR|nr:hypothetical protein [Streptomyces noursei]EXU89942.1 hypothetical protein P354_19390 [Streptomyces noursei PD-1]UWS71505.1 hypothetical protein N1H47_09780 [Streptomyces noursei]GCB90330.1 hypothetical protein SALB_03034 [Streptomyces noursei]
MPNTIVRLAEALLLRLLPARGRHRSAEAAPAPELPDTPTLTIPRVPAELRFLRGEDVALLRPYILTPEERQERRLQRGRRRALWFAVHGIDAGPRWIHGVEVGA